MKRTCYTCANCNYSSLVRSNFKLTPSGDIYCTRDEDCKEEYMSFMSRHNPNARQKGEKVE